MRAPGGCGCAPPCRRRARRRGGWLHLRRRPALRVVRAGWPRSDLPDLAPAPLPTARAGFSRAAGGWRCRAGGGGGGVVAVVRAGGGACEGVGLGRLCVRRPLAARVVVFLLQDGSGLLLGVLVDVGCHCVVVTHGGGLVCLTAAAGFGVGRSVSGITFRWQMQKWLFCCRFFHFICCTGLP